MIRPLALLFCLTSGLPSPSLNAQSATVPVANTAPDPPDASIVFHFERDGLSVPVYTFTLYEHRAGNFVADANGPTTELHLKPQLLSQIFEQVRSTNGFRGGCNSRAHNLANTGAKTLTYTGHEGTFTCTYNYSDSKTITALTDTFLAMEFTIEEGGKLEHYHRFDRLGLDQEMHSLAEAAKANRAQGLANIQPVLVSLVEDPLVLERVRSAATRLIEQANQGR